MEIRLRREKHGTYRNDALLSRVDYLSLVEVRARLPTHFKNKRRAVGRSLPRRRRLNLGRARGGGGCHRCTASLGPASWNVSVTQCDETQRRRNLQGAREKRATFSRDCFAGCFKQKASVLARARDRRCYADLCAGSVFTQAAVLHRCKRYRVTGPHAMSGRFRKAR